MPEFVINSGGMGDSGNVAQTFCAGPLCAPFTTLTPGAISMCNSAAYLFTIPCWGLSRDAWAQAAQLQVPNAVTTTNPAPAQSCATTPPYVCTAGDQDASLAQGAADTQAAALAQAQAGPDDPLGSLDMCETFTASWPAPFDGLTCPTVLLYGAVGVAVLLVGAKLLEKL